MTKYIIISLFFLGATSCNQSSSQTEKDYINNLEEKNRALEKELQEEKNKSSSYTEKTPEPISTLQETQRKAEVPKEYFTIGSTETEVLDIQGDPSSINDLGGSSKLFMYGSSMITFRNGQVVSYSNLDNNLKIRIGSKTKSENSSDTQSEATKGNTKYVYFYCFIQDLNLEIYYSKIYKITDFNEDRLFKIKNCLVEQIRFFKQQSGKIDLFEYTFDSFTKASEQWNGQTGKKIFGDGTCGF
jgi:hypothetical protein